MRVLVGMSGGVDSSVTAALLLERGHEVVGATMKLWGGASDSGCCSAGEVQDARRVADQLGIDHHVFNYTEEFDRHVVDQFVSAHEQGRTPNPCVECNRHIKFGAFLDRALRLGFDAIATGHYARIGTDASGRLRLSRATDRAKDQSYVLSVLSEAELTHVLLPIGDFEKHTVREIALAKNIKTAHKPDSQDLCFVSAHRRDGDRKHFLSDRMTLHEGTIVEHGSNQAIGTVEAVELVTVGQRRGLSFGANGERHYAVSVDVEKAIVTVGSRQDLLTSAVALTERTWVNGPLPQGTPIEAQVSAHGAPRDAVITSSGISFLTPERKVAPGQIVACYIDDVVVGSGIAA